MRIRTILLDDEPKALHLLEEKLNRLFPQIDIVEKFDDPGKALEHINEIKPDLIFLDIAMPRMSGFEFLKKIPNPEFEIIFVTAFGDYAIEAIKHAAIGYVVKPIINEDLIDSVNNALKNIRLKTSPQQNTFLQQSLMDVDENKRKLVIPYEEGLIFSEYDKILRLEGETGYTRIYFTDGSNILSAYNIGHYYGMLSKRIFFQTHKSHIINLSYITKYLNEGLVELNGKHQIPLSRNKKSEFLSIFSR